MMTALKNKMLNHKNPMQLARNINKKSLSKMPCRTYAVNWFLSSWENLLKKQTNRKIINITTKPVILSGPIERCQDQYWMPDDSMRFWGADDDGYMHIISHNPLRAVFFRKLPKQAYYILDDCIIGEEDGSEHEILKGTHSKKDLDKTPIVHIVYNLPTTAWSRLKRCIHRSSLLRKKYFDYFIYAHGLLPAFSHTQFLRGERPPTEPFVQIPETGFVSEQSYLWWTPAKKEGINYHRCTVEYIVGGGKMHFTGKPGFLCIFSIKQLIAFYVHEMPTNRYVLVWRHGPYYGLIVNEITRSAHEFLWGEVKSLPLLPYKPMDKYLYCDTRYTNRSVPEFLDALAIQKQDPGITWWMGGRYY